MRQSDRAIGVTILIVAATVLVLWVAYQAAIRF